MVFTAIFTHQYINTRTHTYILLRKYIETIGLWIMTVIRRRPRHDAGERIPTNDDRECGCGNDGYAWGGRMLVEPGFPYSTTGAMNMTKEDMCDWAMIGQFKGSI